MAVAVKITGLQLHRAQTVASEAVLSRSFLDFRLGERGDRVGHWREKAPATVTQRGVTHFSDVCLVAGGEGPSACDIMLKIVRDGGFVTQHLGQGTLLSKQLVKGSGLLEVELCTEAGYGDVVGTLQMQLTHKGRACFLVPPRKVADDFDWWSSWDEEEEEEDSPGFVKACLGWGQWTLLDHVPLRHDDTWPDLRDKAAWAGRRPLTAQEVAGWQEWEQEHRPFLHKPLALLARCKMALEATDQELPGGALPTLPQIQDKLRRLGVTEAVTRLTHMPPSWGDDVSSLGFGCDPLLIAHKLAIAGLAEKYDPLYRYVFGRGVAEAMEDLPDPWKEEDQHVQRVLRELGR